MTRTDKLKALIRKARSPRSAGFWDHSDLERRPLDQREHPGAAAILIVREALSQFDIPSQVEVTYKGMNRLSGHGQHHLTDGLINVQASFKSLSGHKHQIDVPVIVHGGYMVFPEVFVHQGQTEVMAQSAFDDMLQRGNVYEKMQDRLNMYSPHGSDEGEYVPAVGRGMFVAAQSGFGSKGKEDLENVQEGERYQVYGNRTVGTFSFKDPRTGKVEGYSRGPFSLTDATFVVRPDGRDRVRETGQREVHAWVEGNYISDTAPVNGGSAYYNPFESDEWTDFDDRVKSLTEVRSPRVLMYFAEDNRPRVEYIDPATGEHAHAEVTATRKKAEPGDFWVSPEGVWHQIPGLHAHWALQNWDKYIERPEPFVVREYDDASRTWIDREIDRDSREARRPHVRDANGHDAMDALLDSGWVRVKRGQGAQVAGGPSEFARDVLLQLRERGDGPLLYLDTDQGLYALRPDEEGLSRVATKTKPRVEDRPVEDMINDPELSKDIVEESRRDMVKRVKEEEQGPYDMVIGKQADHSPHGLDPAERDRSDYYRPGDKTSLTDDVQVRLRGGSRLVYPKGTSVTVLRSDGHGTTYYCEFPDGRRAPVDYESLR